MVIRTRFSSPCKPHAFAQLSMSFAARDSSTGMSRPPRDSLLIDALPPSKYGCRRHAHRLVSSGWLKSLWVFHKCQGSIRSQLQIDRHNRRPSVNRTRIAQTYHRPHIRRRGKRASGISNGLRHELLTQGDSRLRNIDVVVVPCQQFRKGAVDGSGRDMHHPPAV